MTETEFKKCFGMSFDEAHDLLIKIRSDSDERWFESVNKGMVSEDERNSISYKVKMKLKMESTLDLLRSKGYDV